MHFLIEEEDLLEKYNATWDKFRAEFGSKSVCNKTFLKTKIKSLMHYKKAVLKMCF